jgi:uncharacterized protein YndB with AHSA1/START domain
MNKELKTSETIMINAMPEKIWDALTNPKKISVYLFGAETITDWNVGSLIFFKIRSEDQVFIDKGIVIENQVNNVLKYKFWSGFCGLEDKPENYSLVLYTIEKLADKKSKFTWTQEGFANEENRRNSQNGLKGILEQIKKISEEQ